ncbi:MAG TPA: GTPase ObgE [Candidatus Saccharimonadales bacterium]|nr:GTPase ObgE [Candidatus Saccharimonadales bacterium]
MNFIDKTPLTVKAGDGGNGALSFRHEKYVDRGGPDGGDGGDGGNIVLVGSRNQNTLAKFRYQKELRAEDGGNGGKRRRHGKKGANLTVALPVGTVIADGAGTVLADLVQEGQSVVIARGGRGGYGNAHFVSSTRQAPRIAEKGEKGELYNLELELKMIADVGLIGLPNAGKSTLLSTISNARPEIADYPFTTLVPNLGVVDVDGEQSLLFADIPGLIEGAAQGKGLGDEFLRHVERTAVLVHLIDAYQTDVQAAYHGVQTELKAYAVDLSSRPQLVVLTKIEGLDEALVRSQLQALRAILPKAVPPLALSAHSGLGVSEFLRKVVAMVKQSVGKQTKTSDATVDQIPILRLSNDDTQWHVVKEKDHFIVNGRKIERFAARTDFSNEAGRQRLRTIMQKMGVVHELARRGAKSGDRVLIGDAGELVY